MLICRLEGFLGHLSKLYVGVRWMVYSGKVIRRRRDWKRGEKPCLEGSNGGNRVYNRNCRRAKKLIPVKITHWRGDLPGG